MKNRKSSTLVNGATEDDCQLVKGTRQAVCPRRRHQYLCHSLRGVLTSLAAHVLTFSTVLKTFMDRQLIVLRVICQQLPQLSVSDLLHLIQAVIEEIQSRIFIHLFLLIWRLIFNYEFAFGVAIYGV